MLNISCIHRHTNAQHSFHSPSNQCSTSLKFTVIPMLDIPYIHSHTNIQHSLHSPSHQCSTFLTFTVTPMLNSPYTFSQLFDSNLHQGMLTMTDVTSFQPNTMHLSSSFC
jgi:hypothetical protein